MSKTLFSLTLVLGLSIGAQATMLGESAEPLAGDPDSGSNGVALAQRGEENDVDSPKVSQEPAGVEPLEGNPKPPSPERRGLAHLYGQVLHPDGSGVAGAVVNLALRNIDRHGEFPLEASQHHTVADSQGYFMFAHLAPGEYSLVGQGDYGLLLRGVRAHEMDLLRILELRPGGPIAGVVTDDAGAPIAGAIVAPYKKDGRHQDGKWLPGLAVRADPRGRFRCEGLFVDRWSLMATAEGHAAAIAEDIPVGSESITIVLSKGRTVSGRVVEAATDRPVQGAAVRVVGAEGWQDTRRAITDASGRFSVSDLREARYMACIDDVELVTEGTWVEFTVAEGEEPDEVRIPVVRGGSISGRVYDAATGEPIAAATVCLDRGRWLPALWAEANAEGRYAFTGLPADPFTMRAEKPGYTMPEEPIQVSAVLGETRVDVDVTLNRQPETARVTGTVIDSESRAIAGAYVYSQAEEGARVSALTDEMGRFELAGLAPANNLYVRAKYADRASEKLGPLTLTDEGVADLMLVLKPAATIQGKLVNALGAPLLASVLKALVTAEPVSLPGAVDGESLTGLQGVFKIGGLSPGTYDLYIRSEKGTALPRTKLARVELSLGQALTDVVLAYEEEGPAISGLVTNAAGEPVVGAEVYARGPSGKASKTGFDGKYALTGLQEGKYTVEVSAAKLSTGAKTDVAAGSADVDFVLEGPGAIEGQVIHADTGEPVTEFQISHRRAQRIKVQDAEGRFRLEDVNAGENEVTARAAGFAQTTVTVPDVRPDQTVTGVTVPLEPGATIQGTIIVKGEPPQYAHVQASADTGEGERFDEAVSADADGVYEIDSVPIGTVRLSVYAQAKDGSHSNRTVTVETTKGQVTPHDFEFVGPGILAGVVSGLSEEHKTMVAVIEGEKTIERLDTQMLRSLYRELSAQSPVNPDGTFRFEKLQAGVYTVVVWAKDGEAGATRHVSQVVDVKGGAEIKVELALP